MRRHFACWPIASTHLEFPTSDCNQIRFDRKVRRISRRFRWTSGHNAARFVNEVTADTTAREKQDQHYSRDRHRRRSFLRCEIDINARKWLRRHTREAVTAGDDPRALNMCCFRIDAASFRRHRRSKLRQLLFQNFGLRGNYFFKMFALFVARSFLILALLLFRS